MTLVCYMTGVGNSSHVVKVVSDQRLHCKVNNILC